MPLELVDTHCHLEYEPLAGSVDGVLQRAQAAGVRSCITIGTTLEASRAAVALAHRYPTLRAAVGVHPHDVGALTDAMMTELEELSADPMVVAIGEVGLDFHRDGSSSARQHDALARFIHLAHRRALPLIFHCRDAYEPLLRVLREQTQPPLRGVMHCASGPPEFIQAALAMGLHISFAGNVTFPNANALRALVPLVPDERLLIETDAPFLAPQPVRGQTNEPAHVAHTAVYLANLRGTTLEALGAHTSRNARRLFGLPEPRFV